MIARLVCWLVGHQEVADGYWNAVPVRRCRRCLRYRHVVERLTTTR